MRRALGLSIVLATIGPAAAATATVYRDIHGVPHIVSVDEEAAWYALGYEHARDQLLSIQVHVKLQRGEALRFGLLPHSADERNDQAGRNDLIVRLLDTHLGNLDPGELRSLLCVPSGASCEANDPDADRFYRDIVAYVEGVEALRNKMATAHCASEQLDDELRQLCAARADLDRLALEWVYLDPITVADIASWGLYNKSLMTWGLARLKVPAAEDALRGAAASSGGAAPASIRDLAAGIADLVPQAPDLGSNGFCWSYWHARDDGEPLSGCVADPHNPPSSYAVHGLPDEPTLDQVVSAALRTSWFVHLDLRSPDGSPSHSVFGYLPPGSASMFVSHNDHIAYGGSLGSPNIADTFLLRLAVDRSGQPVDPPAYCDPYLLAPNADPTGCVAQPFERVVVAIPRSDGSSLTRVVYRAGYWGFVPALSSGDLPVLWIDPDAAWRLGQQGDNAFLVDPPPPGSPASAPAVVLRRLPVDPHVTPDARRKNGRLAVGFYRLMMQTRSILDVWQIVASHDLDYFVEFVSADREGRLFATLLGSVPLRGDASVGALDEGKLFDAYDCCGDGEPIPMRHRQDLRFDWRYVTDGDPGSGPRLLEPWPPTSASDIDYQPYFYYDPANPDANNPPTEVDESLQPWEFENAGYLTASNDMVWSFHRRRFDVQLDPDNRDDIVSTDNGALQAILDHHTIYHTAVMGAVPLALPKNQAILSTFERIAAHWLGRSDSAPPLSEPEVLDLAQGNWEFAPGVEELWTGAAAPVAVPVRIQQEILDHWSELVTDFDRERAFFQDLWNALTNPPPGSSWERWDDGTGASYNGHSLYDLWVANRAGGPVYYPDATDAGPGVILPMPDPFALIDFSWPETEVLLGDGIRRGPRELGHTLDNTDGIFDAAERERWAGDVGQLVAWDATSPPDRRWRYRMNAGSRSALRLEEYRRGLDAGVVDEVNFDRQRHWTPLFRGSVGWHTAMPGESWYCRFAPDSTDALPDPPGASGPTTKVRFGRPWREFASAAFPLDPRASLFGTESNPIDALGFPDPPYGALYADAATRAVKTRLTRSDVDAIVEFFLRLGGFWDEPTRSSTKLATWQAVRALCDAGTRCSPDDGAEWCFSRAYRTGYPLTRSMWIMALAGRLLDAGDWVRAALPQDATLGAVQRMSAFAPTGDDLAAGRPAADGGFIRAIDCSPPPLPSIPSLDLAILAGTGRGFQTELRCSGGSRNPLVVLLSAPDGESPRPVRSWFWIQTGQDAMNWSGPHASDHVGPVAGRRLLPSLLTGYDQALSPHYYGGAPVVRSRDEGAPAP